MDVLYKKKLVQENQNDEDGEIYTGDEEEDESSHTDYEEDISFQEECESGVTVVNAESEANILDNISVIYVKKFVVY